MNWWCNTKFHSQSYTVEIQLSKEINGKAKKKAITYSPKTRYYIIYLNRKLLQISIQALGEISPIAMKFHSCHYGISSNFFCHPLLHSSCCYPFFSSLTLLHAFLCYLFSHAFPLLLLSSRFFCDLFSSLSIYFLVGCQATTI